MKRALVLVLLTAVACTTAPTAPPPAPVTTTVAEAPAPPPPPPADPIRAKAPAPSAPRPYDFPDVDRSTLDNGLRVLVARQANAPLVTVRALVRSGADHDPANHAGLATLTASLADEGAGSRNAVQLAEAVGTLGASLNAGADYDMSWVNLDILSTNLDEGFALFADVVRRPRFDQSDFDRVKKERQTTLLQQRDQAGAIAQNRFAQFVYGDTPYGRPLIGTNDTIGRVTRSDVRDFYRRHWLPNNTSIIVTGDIEPVRARELVRRHFGDWKRGQAVPDVTVTAAPIEQSRIFLIDRPAAVQSELRIGHVGVARSTEDYFPLLVMNTLLGGQFTSRLNLNLREKHGYTYGARSAFGYRRQPGPFVASAAVRNQVTMESVRETLSELRRVRTGDVSDEELTFARDFLIGSFPATVQSAAELAQRISDMELYGLPETYFESYRERLAAVTKDDINRVAQKYVNPDRMVVLVVGKASEIRDPLQSLGLPVGVYDVEGRPLAN